jgi:hypothetical protein
LVEKVNGTNISYIRVILKLIMNSGRELVVLLTKPSMFGKFLVYAWR